MTRLVMQEPDAHGVTLIPEAARPGLLRRLFGAAAPGRPLRAVAREEEPLALALADAVTAAGEDADALRVEDGSIRLSHAVAARLDGDAAEALGLPPLTDLTFATGAAGMLGQPQFRLTCQWERNGARAEPRRVGAFLKAADGWRRIPAFLLSAIELAEAPDPPSDREGQWRALARFRQALDPETAAQPPPADFAGRMRLNDFLNGLTVRVADALAISPFEREGALDFAPLPFSRRSLDARHDPSLPPTEAEGLLSPPEQAAFAERFRLGGARPAYAIGENAYLVIERAAQPTLDAMAAAVCGGAAARQAFVLDPQPAIARAARALLQREGRLADAAGPEAEALVEAEVAASLIETQEYADRVVGKGRWQKPTLPIAEAARTTWLPEDFDGPALPDLGRYDLAACQSLAEALEAAIREGAPVARAPDGAEVPARPEVAAAVAARIAALEGAGGRGPSAPSDPVAIETIVNFHDVLFRARLSRRAPPGPVATPDRVTTSLLAHQAEALRWMADAWRGGLPGVLNADEQGLGKTLQTLAFLCWLQDAAAGGCAAAQGPVLIVAPTTLLENWEDEARRHLDSRGLGTLLRLYGGELARMRRAPGVETDDGEERLDLAPLLGRGPVWALTTYQTLTNFQHSLARAPFAAVVFDEIQALKNPAALRSAAARAVRATFRIGLTGTPVENRIADLWSIMDQLTPGALDSLKAFEARYGAADAEGLTELHGRVFGAGEDGAPFGLRRLKEDVARDLPPKRRLMHPRLMPQHQAARYAAAREALRAGGRGAALRMLHHIRAVSAHPDLDAGGGGVGDDFIAASARLSTTMGILRWVRMRGERALVFIEHERLQQRFIAVARKALGLCDIALINGSTPLARRMAIVRRFQRHLQEDEGFDLLVLAPHAAGVGLTLTAANHIIHLSRWWNPAVEEQCNDRAHRIGQTRPVTVHTPMAIHPEFLDRSFDCLLESLMRRKRLLARHALAPSGETPQDSAALEDALRLAPAARHPVDDIDPSRLAGLAQGGTDDGVERLTWRDGGSGHLLLTRDAHALRRARSRSGDADAVIATHADNGGEGLNDQAGPPVIWAGGALAALWPDCVATGAGPR